MTLFATYPERVLVTGAASGIGRETALLLRELGVAVVAADRAAEGLAELERAGARTVVGDVTAPADRERMLAVAESLDGLVNAAGLMRLAALEDMSDDLWDTTFAVNVKATFYLARDAGLRMPRGGSIVNVSSVSARRGATVEVLPYAASKAAVLAVTRGLAHAFGDRGVRVNAVLPGLIDTPMQDAVLERVSAIRNEPLDGLAASRTAAVPLEQRQGSPRECAESIVYLLSGASSYVSGQSLSIDGGLIMP